ncbi:MAG: lycopene cyclase domain-containing protein [Chitinophagales bacterium]|nr:lycopene cyclase domain-containing protein [Chitinophagales bacterium]MDW8427649.1 lycopene cyclase domain-containing protein [Chitinophagales bacterium]
MNERFSYLAINIAVVAVPIAFSFEPQLRFFRHWLRALTANLLVAVPFLLWDVWFTAIGVWQFNSDYTLGITWKGLPLEEIMFFISIPFACLFLYENIKKFFAQAVKLQIATPFIFMVGASLLVAVAVGRPKLYTAICCGALAPLLLVLALTRYPRNGVLVLTYLIHLVPFALINGLLTALPVVIYNDAFNSGLRLGTIPVEDLAYSGLLLIFNILCYEWLGKR